MFLVRPQNSEEHVDELFNLFAEHKLGFNADTVIKLDEIDSGI